MTTIFKQVMNILVPCLIVLALMLAPRQASAQVQPGPGLLDISAKAWAQEAATNEIAIILHSDSYIRYRQRSIDSKGDELRDVIESKDGTVARLIQRDGRALTAEEDQAERDRLSGLLDHPSDFAQHVKKDANGKKQAVDMIRLMPDAMIFAYVPGQPQTSESSAPQVVIDYSPDPKFNPPTTASQALTGLRGRIWIDAGTKTIVRMNGEIFQGINFGWGMLAHIYPGGKVDVEQADALGTRWNMTHFHEHVTVKALMVKTINVNAEVHSMDFQPLPGPVSYQEAIHMLLDSPLPK
jgi:hypothetical protein